jgi:hypothetical protein
MHARDAVANVVERAIAHVSGPDGRSPLHLSLDIDAVDPNYAPGTGTTARGGLNYREVHYICEELAISRRLVSMDLVEVNPALDPPPTDLHMHGDNEAIAVVRRRRAQPQVLRSAPCSRRLCARESQTSPTVRLAIELALSALGRQIIGNVPPSQFEKLHKPT